MEDFDIGEPLTEEELNTPISIKTNGKLKMFDS